MLFTQVIVYIDAIVLYSALCYIIVKINKIEAKLNVHTLQNNEKNMQSMQSMQKELKLMKSKSFDMADSNIMLRSSYNKLEDDVRVLKYKEYYNSRDILRCSNLINDILIRETDNNHKTYDSK